MEIIIDNPPNIAKIDTFLETTKHTIYAYGDKIYNPNNNKITPGLIAHEEVHSRQQGDSPEDWWNRYLVDSDFRLSQEVEAYQAQFQEARKIIRDRNKQFNYLHFLAQDLSGPLYGKIISYLQAVQAIKGLKPIRFKV